jgi:hypothetical protein
VLCAANVDNVSATNDDPTNAPVVILVANGICCRNGRNDTDGMVDRIWVQE